VRDRSAASRKRRGRRRPPTSGQRKGGKENLDHELRATRDFERQCLTVGTRGARADEDDARGEREALRALRALRAACAADAPERDFTPMSSSEGALPQGPREEPRALPEAEHGEHLASPTDARHALPWQLSLRSEDDRAADAQHTANALRSAAQAKHALSDTQGFARVRARDELAKAEQEDAHPRELDYRREALDQAQSQLRAAQCTTRLADYDADCAEVAVQVAQMNKAYATGRMTAKQRSTGTTSSSVRLCRMMARYEAEERKASQS